MTEYIGKHAKIDVLRTRSAFSGSFLHGKLWMRCPYCMMAQEISGRVPFREKGGYCIYKCACGSLFRVR